MSQEEDELHKRKDTQEMTIYAEIDEQRGNDNCIPPMDTDDQTSLKNEILDYVANSKAIFKSQQKDDPELTFNEKRSIVLNVLEKNYCLFLSKFGKFLKKEHLSYFDKVKDEDYEIAYHINRLQRYYNNSSRHIDVKNRRYQALKSMIEKGEYFSETEMMKRNPLLYEHLIGQYLTEEQKKTRDNIDTQNITFVNLLMERIERDRLSDLKKVQQDAEDNVVEENDSDENSDEDSIDSRTTNDEEKNDPKWGEIASKNSYKNEEFEKRTHVFPREIPSKERQMLRNEFMTNMYQNFLDGKDIDFDYSTVDDNEAYDNVDLRTQDEEEKYFDSESPEMVLPKNEREQNESEDELDLYMKSLQVK